MSSDSKPNLNNTDLGLLIFRLTVGGLMLFHGYSKLTGGVSGIESMLVGKGMPGFIAYGVYVGEVVTPLLMMIGLFTRPAALIFAFNMIAAVGLAHSGDFLAFNDRSGAPVLELQYFYFFTAIALAFTGSGKYAVSKGKGKFD